VPPANVRVAVTEADCPRSKAEGEKARDGLRAGFTSTVAAKVELAFCGTVASSTTVAQKNDKEDAFTLKVVIALATPSLGIPKETGLWQSDLLLVVSMTMYGGVPLGCHATVSVTGIPASVVTLAGETFTTVPANAELIVPTSSAHALWAGVPMLLSLTSKE
jgi:uncharacterized membrane protein YqaE (UPF0057 family)